MMGRSREGGTRQEPGGESADDERERLLHDLQQHQAELEAQNDELRRTQLLLEESRNRYVDLYDLAPVAYLTLDRRCRIVEANLQASSLFGIERRKIVGLYFPSIMKPTRSRQLRLHLEGCLAQGAETSDEIACSPRGEEIIAKMASVTVRDPVAGVVGCRVTLTDISALKRSQQRLSLIAAVSRVLSGSLESEWPARKVLRLLVSSMGDLGAIDVLNEDGTLRRLDVVSKEPARLGLDAPGAGPRSSLPSPQTKVLSTKTAILLGDCARATLSRERLDPSFVARAKAESAIFVPLLIRGSAMGVITLISCRSTRRYSTDDLEVTLDIASRVAATMENARLYRASQNAVVARDRTLAMTSHDLQNPLMSLALTLDGVLGDARSRRHWATQRLRRARQTTFEMSRVLRAVAELSAWTWPIKPADTQLTASPARARATRLNASR
jgi:PAS domain S-box-containing protein